MAETNLAAGAAGGATFSLLSDDVVLNIFMKLEGDPRDWGRIACVSTRFSALVNDCCYRLKCSRCIPSLVSDLFSTFPSSGQAAPLASSVVAGALAPPGGWSALHKLSICCPGLLHAGVLLENSDFGLEREIGPDENYRQVRARACDSPPPPSSSSPSSSASSADCSWSLFDDLYFDAMCDASEAPAAPSPAVAEPDVGGGGEDTRRERKKARCERSHVSSGGAWSLTREQGNKLLAGRFREDSLYICNWPGCVHEEEKRKYMLFQGFFKDFKRSRVWRTINDGHRSKIALNCAFCSCRGTWDLHSAFCLRRVFGFHDDGDPVVRAFVCENGHVSGAWTEQPSNT
ncbi:unnamed protein product [Spirodela intermedia]|uniref:Uncharacterized protein n=1 Tax=Spirodela intermedia TaxID=51605 RepID=A0A7I8JY14_SPIIN|nr:unnamed protein product [Spirodela intermedia]